MDWKGRDLNKLSAAGAKSAGKGKHHDGHGLYLVKASSAHGKWVLRQTIYGRRREMGLGRFPQIGLAEARRAADDARLLIRLGRDPITERHQDYKTTRHLLTDIAAAAFEARRSELKGDGKAGRWLSPLQLHVLPKLGNTPVVKLTQTDIADTLRPIWHTKGETARKALNRLGIVLRHAAAMGLDVDLQLTKKASALLGKSRQKVRKTPALHWKDVPAFYATLNEGTVTQLALRFLILTGTRSTPVRFARFDEIQNDIWTIPAANMKATKDKAEDFRIPLSKPALEIVDTANEFERDGYLFPSVRKGVISDATMSRLMERRGIEARPHGFRSSLRTWLADCTDATFEVAETILAHQPMNKVQRAYQRSDYFEQRAVLMERWAQHVSS